MKPLSLLTLPLLLLAFWAVPAWAENGSNTGSTESPKAWTIHIGFGEYRLLKIDDEFKSGSSPMNTIFSKDMRFHFQAGLERLLWQEVGTIGIEAAFGYWDVKGKGLYPSGEKSPDETIFRMMPFKLSLVYRFNYLWEHYGVPLVPYGKFGFDYYLWWIENQNGDISSYKNSAGKSFKGIGGTFGMHVSYGLQICLDFIDQKLATEFDQDIGVNNTFLYIEGNYAMVNDFWSGKSFDLSDHHLLAGILLEF